MYIWDYVRVQYNMLVLYLSRAPDVNWMAEEDSRVAQFELQFVDYLKGARSRIRYDTLTCIVTSTYPQYKNPLHSSVSSLLIFKLCDVSALRSSLAVVSRRAGRRRCASYSTCWLPRASRRRRHRAARRLLATSPLCALLRARRTGDAHCIARDSNTETRSLRALQRHWASRRRSTRTTSSSVAWASISNGTLIWT